jgi:uncharacterized phage protein gp47/JayE
MAYGLTATGFNAKPTAQVITDINARLYTNLSPTLNLSAASALGQLVGTVGADIGELWQLTQAVYSAFDPNQAAGDQLASLSLLTGTIKRDATKSVAKAVTVNVNPGTYAPGTLSAYPVNNPTAVFSNVSTVTNAGGVAANVSADFQAVNKGPTLAPAGTLTVIASPVSGFNSVTNPTDAIAGLTIESDAALRQRRALELSSGGAATAAAIRSQILSSLGLAAGGDVISASVLVNDKDTTDTATGLPPHSIECIVRGAVGGSTNDAALAAEIMAIKGAGDTAVGTSSLPVLDAAGNSHNIGFTRPTTVRIYINSTVQQDPNSTSLVTASAVQTAIVAWAQANLGQGQNVVAERIKAVELSVPGALDVLAFTIGTAPSPVGTGNVTISQRQIASISSGDINVTVSA